MADIPRDLSSNAVLDLGVPFVDAIETVGDTDWLGLDVEAGKSYIVDLHPAYDAAPGPHLVSAQTVLRDPAGEEIARHLHASGRRYFFTAEADGRMFIEIAGRNNGTGSYELLVAEGTDIPNDASTDAVLSAPSPVESSLDFAGDEDWIRLDAVAGEGYQITLDGGPSSILYANIDVVTATGEVIASYAQHNSVWKYTFLYETEETGSVFIVLSQNPVQSRDHAIAYNLSLEAPTDDASADVSTTATIALDTETVVTIDHESDRDWYRFNAEAGKIYKIVTGNATVDGEAVYSNLRPRSATRPAHFSAMAASVLTGAASTISILVANPFHGLPIYRSRSAKRRTCRPRN